MNDDKAFALLPEAIRQYMLYEASACFDANEVLHFCLSYSEEAVLKQMKDICKGSAIAVYGPLYSKMVLNTQTPDEGIWNDLLSKI